LAREDDLGSDGAHYVIRKLTQDNMKNDGGSGSKTGGFSFLKKKRPCRRVGQRKKISQKVSLRLKKANIDAATNNMELQLSRGRR